jgi:hypothetical protein
MRLLFFLLLTACFGSIQAQELYIYTNPASNIPGGALVVKASTKSLQPVHGGGREFRFSPEMQWGLHKNLMLTSGISFSNMFSREQQRFESARLYAKYRFYSADEVHRHFRVATFAAASVSNNPLVYQELNLDGDVSGWQAGLVATQLVQKFAVSGGASFVQQMGQKKLVTPGIPFSKEAVQYNLSVGYLLFPRSYNNYRQVNLNLYCELLGQQNTDIRRGYADLAPGVQLIFKSSTRLNAAARWQLGGTAHRMARESFFISLEHYFLNALK